MATFTTATVIANSRTPESVVWDVANSGGEDSPTLSVSRTNVLAALLPGPLRERLFRTADWTIFNLGSTGARFIRWTAIVGGLDATLQPPLTTAIVIFHADSIEFSLGYDNEGFVACRLLVEMRAEHSNER
jgi:hypothetical protein